MAKRHIRNCFLFNVTSENINDMEIQGFKKNHEILSSHMIG